MTPNITNDVVKYVAPKAVILRAWGSMVKGINNACSDGIFVSMARGIWFGEGAESSAELMHNFKKLQNFINSRKPLTIAFDITREDSDMIAYTHSKRKNGTLRIVPAIYLTTKFTSPTPSIGVMRGMHNFNTLGVQTQTLAHELSHIVLGANNPCGGFHNERYDRDALNLARHNPIYALNNADNYGYCIEMCS